MHSPPDASNAPRPQALQPVALGLGSNLGDRLAHLRGGLAGLRRHMGLTVVSSVFETEPVGLTEQPRFLNAVALFETDAPPPQVLAWAQQAEQAERRERTVRWGPRTLDVDVLMFGNLTLDSPDLVVPHPRLVERAFVLAPLAEVAPAWVHPVLGVSVRELWAAVQQGGVRLWRGPGWEDGGDGGSD